MSQAKLTDKQERFIQEYLIDLNATQAAIRAGYSENTARAIGYENLTKPHIQESIAEARKAAKDRLEITVDMKRKLLWETALFASEQDVFGDDKPVVKQRNPAATVASIKELNAMDGDHAATKSEITGNGGGPIQLTRTIFKNKDAD